MTPFTQEVVRIIRIIPAGKVMTFGQIARYAGSPRAARQVVRIVHSMSDKHGLPWQRVVNTKGEIGLRDTEGFLMQRMLLQAEGVEVDEDGRINLAKYQYEPGNEEMKKHDI